ncbi:DUF3108 domain-containing protein [Hyphococcus sp.]|uniref:DUF3108 domain-containing protein n=1 Tax=Hyphococcus sp. TaxID=2038636 RepID=UPI002084E2F5|nr:MAG: hypothetical protein DHS20C04_07030 [Marinicaulis sp.]
MTNQRITVFAAASLAAIFIPVAAVAEPFPVDLSQVEFAPARYQLIHHGEKAGEMYFAMERKEDVIVIHDGTTLLPDVRESGTVVVDAETLLPKRIVIDGDFSRTILDIDLTFDGRKGTGVRKYKRPTDIEKAERPFEIELPEDAIARTSLFGFVSGLPWRDGATFKLQWFEELGGVVADAELVVAGRETIEVPSGMFETFKVNLNAEPANVIYLTTAKPHRIVRIDVPAQEMRFERLAEQPSAE